MIEFKLIGLGLLMVIGGFFLCKYAYERHSYKDEYSQRDGLKLFVWGFFGMLIGIMLIFMQFGIN